MRFGSLFSGIGGFDLGFEQAGMECVWQCEIDNAARSVLAKHWPGVPCIEDVRNVTRNNVPAVDLVCGGFPCQDVSVAGKRAGLAGDRSGLWFEFHRILTELRPQWVVIENVPGLLSSNRGADFAIILRGLVECGYGVTWRVLDAQYFGVAQRRRRVFIVGSLGDGRSAQVLFEREGLFGHPPALRAQGESLTPSVANGINSSGLRGRQPVSAALTVGSTDQTVVAKSLGAHHGRLDLDHDTYITIPDVAYALADATGSRPGTGRDAQDTFIFEPRYARNGRGAPDTIAPPLKAQNGGTGKGDGAPVVAGALHSGMPGRDASDAGNGHLPGGVRRLTPTECERLQGFTDGWTAGQSDSARYRQLGNAVAVPVARWIGTRIMEVLS